MKDIREIMMEMDNITKEQLAADLSDNEKQELINLINTTAVDVTADCIQPTPTPTIPPCPTTDLCTSQNFCCVVSFPKSLTALQNEVFAAVVSKDVKVDPDGRCAVDVGNCSITLDKAKISGSAQIIISLGVRDRCGNTSFVSCSDFVCLCNKNIICCGLPDPAKIKFNISKLCAQPLADACNGNTQVWQISGTISFTCQDC